MGTVRIQNKWYKINGNKICIPSRCGGVTAGECFKCECGDGMEQFHYGQDYIEFLNEIDKQQSEDGKILQKYNIMLEDVCKKCLAKLWGENRCIKLKIVKNGIQGQLRFTCEHLESVNDK